jgi:hypothetical protein
VVEHRIRVALDLVSLGRAAVVERFGTAGPVGSGGIDIAILGDVIVVFVIVIFVVVIVALVIVAS